ncbi:hypothetical protein [Aeromonas veronii]|uniref:hypothetical protein n=1 Tax=Aeromonas veronii TaxID=654 RepID=UPI003B9E0925
MKLLDKLVNESIDVERGRDELIAVSKKTSNKIYKKLVGEQATTQPIATVYGIGYHADNKDPFSDHSVAVVETAATYDENKEYQAGEKFSVNSIVYETLDYIAHKEANSPEGLCLTGKLRLVTDAPITSVEKASSIKINRWRSPVGSRLIRFDASMEMLQDLDRAGVNSDNVIHDVISTVIAESINSDIVNKLITISRKQSDISLINDETSYYRGRELIIKLGEMIGDIKQRTTALPSFVLCTPRVEAQLRASGQVTGNVIDGLNIEIVCDTKTKLDYVLVGCASDEPMNPSSLYFSPLVVNESEMEFLFTREMLNMQPSYGVLARYALTTATPEVTDGGKVIDMDWRALANKSPFTSLARVML